MKKYIFTSVGLVVLAVAGFFLFQERDDLRSYFDVKLSSVSIPHELLAPLQEHGFLPEPLRASQESQQAENALLTRAGTIRETNEQRATFGLTLFKENTKLNQAANLKLKDMFEKQYFEHIAPDGKGPSDLATVVGYEYVVVGENLALGNFANDAALVEAWMNSPGHRENILNERYTEIGVAVGKGTYEGKETWLAVQSFGAPLSSCPAPSEQLKADIATNQTLLNAMEEELEAMQRDLDTNKNAPDYNQKVVVYNQKVQSFNELVAKTKEQVATYNAQINAFNACVKG